MWCPNTKIAAIQVQTSSNQTMINDARAHKPIEGKSTYYLAHFPNMYHSQWGCPFSKISDIMQLEDCEVLGGPQTFFPPFIPSCLSCSYFYNSCTSITRLFYTLCTLVNILWRTLQWFLWPILLKWLIYPQLCLQVWSHFYPSTTQLGRNNETLHLTNKCNMFSFYIFFHCTIGSASENATL